MARYVVLVDISGSMTCKLKILKEFLQNYWLPWLMGTPPTNEVALISFSNDVCVLSRYTTDIVALKNLISGLATSGCGGPMTSLYDAIIVGLVFENPKPHGLYVWSDLGDTQSDASASDWQGLANSLAIPVNLCPPYPWMEDPNCRQMAVIVTPPIKVIPYAQSLQLATKITAKLELARVIKDPQEFPKTKAVEKR